VIRARGASRCAFLCSSPGAQRFDSLEARSKTNGEVVRGTAFFQVPSARGLPIGLVAFATLPRIRTSYSILLILLIQADG
jgi:hypothetical protein